MIKFVAHGIMIDDIVYPDGKTQMAILGGGGPQSAWGMAAALSDGQEIGLVAGIHHNENEAILTPLSNAYINLDGIRRNDLPTPRAWQVLEHNGLRRHVWRVPVETLPLQLERGWRISPESYRQATYFHWGMDPGDASKDIQWAQELKEKGIHVCLEPHQASAEPLTLDQLKTLLKYCHTFSVNIGEAEGITGLNGKPMLKRFQEAGCHYLLLRQAENGADVWDLSRGIGAHVPAIKTTVVDVVGAGNAFTGAFLARLEDGIETAACHASTAASYMIEQIGLPLNLPDAHDYQRRMADAQNGLYSLTF